MEPDSPRRSLDAVERAHLRAPGDRSHAMYRYEPDEDLAPLVQRFWIPVWSVPPGAASTQQVLQYPVALLVVAPDHARFNGVVTGLSTTTLAGEGWAVGVMCTPAAGALVAGGPMARHTDRHVDISTVLGDAGTALTARVRAAMAADPHAAAAHRTAMAAFGDVLRPLLPVDAEGELVDRVVALVEGRPELLRVGQLCAETGLSERALQRLLQRRLGLTPKWLVQRRRLQEAAERLRVAGRHRRGAGLRRPGALRPGLLPGHRHHAGPLRRPAPVRPRLTGGRVGRSAATAATPSSTVTRSPCTASSSRKAIEARVRPPYASRQSMPWAWAAATIVSSGVIPTPPARKRYRDAGTRGKALRGPPTPTRSPAASTSCT